MLRPTDLPFIIKICGITNEEDARVAIDAGANALGFNFYAKSPRYISFTRAKEIMDAVPGEYLRVGIFVNPSEDDVLQALNYAPLDVLQLHGDDCPRLISHCVWKALAPDQDEAAYSADAYLLDTPSEAFGGSGKIFDWRLAMARSYRILIAGGLDGSNVAEAIGTALPWGVDACSGLELRPGKKDAQKIVQFVASARQGFLTHMQQEISL